MNILITGGASGLGRAITSALAINKDNLVYFTYCNSKQEAINLEQEFSNVKGIHCDFTNDESILSLLAEMEKMQLQVLINNAMQGLYKVHFHKMKTNDFLSSFNTNVLQVVKISQKAIEMFRKVKFGKIITVLSSAIINKPPIGWSTYVAEKNYLLSLSKSIATENVSFNITSNCISPSFMLTDLNKDVDERILEDMESKHPLKKFLTINETAESIVFLVAANQQINGINMIINAGSDLN